MRLALLWILIPIALAACLADHVERRAPATERERDSVIGASRLPGAKGVQGALRASDSADSRRVREDSVAREP
jgi:hypothetical protein